MFWILGRTEIVKRQSISSTQNASKNFSNYQARKLRLGILGHIEPMECQKMIHRGRGHKKGHFYCFYEKNSNFCVITCKPFDLYETEGN